MTAVHDDDEPTNDEWAALAACREQAAAWGLEGEPGALVVATLTTGTLYQLIGELAHPDGAIPCPALARSRSAPLHHHAARERPMRTWSIACRLEASAHPRVTCRRSRNVRARQVSVPQRELWFDRSRLGTSWTWRGLTPRALGWAAAGLSATAGEAQLDGAVGHREVEAFLCAVPRLFGLPRTAVWYVHALLEALRHEVPHVRREESVTVGAGRPQPTRREVTLSPFRIEGPGTLIGMWELTCERAWVRQWRHGDRVGFVQPGVVRLRALDSARELWLAFNARLGHGIVEWVSVAPSRAELDEFISP